MSIVSFRIVCVAAVTVFFTAACADDTPSQAETGTTTDDPGSTMTMGMTTQSMTTVAMDTGTTVAMDTGTTVADTGTTVAMDTGTSGSSDSGSTGSTGSSGSSGSSEDTGTTGAVDCVDEDIGMAVGPAVASGTTMGQGDDFLWDDCFGNSDTGFPSDTGGGDVGGMGGTPEPDLPSKGKFGGKMKGPGDDYVIAWTPPSTASYVLSLEGSSYDTYLSVHPTVCGSVDEDCNDDCYDVQSGMVYDATMGEAIFIVVDGFAGKVGNFTLSITEGDDPVCEFGSTDDFGSDDFGSATVGFDGDDDSPPPGVFGTTGGFQ